MNPVFVPLHILYLIYNIEIVYVSADGLVYTEGFITASLLN